MISQFNNVSTWRERNVTIQPKVNETITFNDTKPNIFFIQNPNETKLHIGISKYPTADTFEFKCEKNTSKSIGRPIGSSYLYIYNYGEVEADIKIFSIEAEFDMNMLNTISLELDGINVVTDGIVKGFEEGVQLPAGSNLIGKVSLDAPEKVDLDNIDKNLTSLYSKFGSLTKNASVSGVTNLFDLLTGLQAVKTSIEALELTTGEITVEGTATDLTSVHEYLSTISTRLKNLLNNGSLEGMVNLYNLEEELSIIRDRIAQVNQTLIDLPTAITQGEKLAKDVIYHNNVVEITYTATEDCKVHFDYLLNDSQSFVTVKRFTTENDNTETEEALLTILEGEQFGDFEIELQTNQRLTVTGTNSLMRAKVRIF